MMMIMIIDQVNFNCVKPILIVVVVVDIDVVFLKNMLGQKQIWLKKSMSNKLQAKKFWVKKSQVQKSCGPKNFGYKNFLPLKIWNLTLKFGQN